MTSLQRLNLAGLLPKVALFVVTATLGAVVASLAVAALQDRTPASTATTAPQLVLSGGDTPGAGGPAAFDVAPTGPPVPVQTLAPADLALAANNLIGAEPVSYLNPSGFPRIPPITQFDGGPFQGANCTLASGAMLARLGYGIVTSGSILRTLQDDQDGGTGLDDLSTALWRGYGIHFPSGLIKLDTLKNLLKHGYGAVVQGDYSKIPVGLRLQPSFTGTHAIYLDGWYRGNPGKGIPEAYYVIDPIGRPASGYEGDWWPASLVDAFASTFGGGRAAAMWGYPPGGTPPDVVGPDVLPIPPGGGGGGGGSGPTPSPSAGGGPSPSPSGPVITPVEPGDLGPVTPVLHLPPIGVSLGGVDLIPELSYCLITPLPPGCPTGIEATFEVDIPPVIQLVPGPDVSIVFVDSDRANVAIVGFTVDPPTAATVRYWEADGSPATIRTPSAMSSISLFGKTVLLAELDVSAATTYQFQAVAGSGLAAGTSPVGEFTTGDGVEQFDVALSQASNPVFELGGGLSPYLHLAPNALAPPMIPLVDLGGGSCAEPADFGGTGYCVDLGGGGVPTAVCTRAQVHYELSGIDATGVLVRAYPAEEGVTPGGDITLDGVLEADGPAPSGDVSVGCLASGLTYHIVLDAVGDDRGILASEDVTVP